MNGKEKPPQEIKIKGLLQIDLPEFYKELNEAIRTHNIQIIYQLSKMYARSIFKKLDN
ncbi:MAG: hypothetical protein ACXAEX_21160 [Promethearchaeota archaeon]